MRTGCEEMRPRLTDQHKNAHFPHSHSFVVDVYCFLCFLGRRGDIQLCQCDKIVVPNILRKSAGSSFVIFVYVRAHCQLKHVILYY